jgi:hypothetical protein
MQRTAATTWVESVRCWLRAFTLWFRHDGGGTVAGGPGQKIIDKTVLFHDFWIVVHTNSDPPPGPGLGSLLFFT